MCTKGPSDVNVAGGKIYGSVKLTVNPPQIQHQNIINKHPYIIVSGKLKGHRLDSACRVNRSIGGLTELHVHGHTQMVVHGVVGAEHAAGQSFTSVHTVKHFIALVKGKEIPHTLIPVSPNGGRRIIKDKMVAASLLTELRKVLAHIIVIVALVV